VARAQGFTDVLSPLLAAAELQPYVLAGMEIAEPIVALQGLAEDIAAHPVRTDVGIRRACTADLGPLVELDASCFDGFWRYGIHELRESLSRERVTIAEKDGRVMGYATCSLYGASATLGRLAVSRDSRREGVARALLVDVAGFAARAGVFAVTLCTQESNTDSRALYAATSFVELPERYALAARRA